MKESHNHPKPEYERITMSNDTLPLHLQESAWKATVDAKAGRLKRAVDPKRKL